MENERYVVFVWTDRKVLGGGHLPTASPAIPEPDSRRPNGRVITVQQEMKEKYANDK